MSIQSCQITRIDCRTLDASFGWDRVMGQLINHFSWQNLPQNSPLSGIHRDDLLRCDLARPTATLLESLGTPPASKSGLLANDKEGMPQERQRRIAASEAAHLWQSISVGSCVPSDSNLPVIGTLPDHFAESVRLARNSQHSARQASERQLRATWMLQDAAVVANCNTYNRNQPVRELRKGLFFRGRRRGAGIDSTSESFRTAFQTIYDWTGIQTAENCRMHAIQISDNPRHAPSVQC